MVHDAADVPKGPESLDQVRVVFDEPRLISDAGLLLAGTLADRLGLEELVNDSVWLDAKAAGAAMPGRKVMSLVHGMLAGADSIDDMNILRAGSTSLVLGHRVMAPRRWGPSCERSRSGMSANWIECWTSRCAGRGRRERVRATGCRW
jgi:hypothetical protein